MRTTSLPPSTQLPLPPSRMPPPPQPPVCLILPPNHPPNPPPLAHPTHPPPLLQVTATNVDIASVAPRWHLYTPFEVEEVIARL